MSKTRSSIRQLTAILAILACVVVAPASRTAKPGAQINVASTTSTDNSGLLTYLLPEFTAETGIDVRVIVVGTGQAMRIGRNGDADVLLVHHEPSEIEFVAEGYGVARIPVMYNDFVLVGPSADPAGITGKTDVADALLRIASTSQAFVSRGDESGTHSKERELWRQADFDPTEHSGKWYRESGSGMGATLNIASGIDGYTLTDRATWMKFANKGTLQVLLEGDARLFNPYSAILVNPRRHAPGRAADGQTFIDWLTSDRGQAAIGAYRIGGAQAFFPDARRVMPAKTATRREGGAGRELP